jgi:hypothetical protein
VYQSPLHAHNSCSHFTVCTLPNLQPVCSAVQTLNFCSGNKANYSIVTLNKCATSIDTLCLLAVEHVLSNACSCKRQLRRKTGRVMWLCWLPFLCRFPLATFAYPLIFFTSSCLFQISLIINLIPLTLI